VLRLVLNYCTYFIIKDIDAAAKLTADLETKTKDKNNQLN
jgi:hypothetical protein